MRRALPILLALAALAGVPASAAAVVPQESWGVVNQVYGPVFVEHGPVVYQRADGSAGVNRWGIVKNVSGGAAFEACVLYTKAWRNHTLILNHPQPCSGTEARPRHVDWRFPAGTRLTAQTFFDVRYRYPGVTYTHRFTSPRTAIVTR